MLLKNGKLVTIIMIIFIISISSVALLSDTHINEDISTNSTWEVSGSPYIIDADIDVLSGVTFNY